MERLLSFPKPTNNALMDLFQGLETSRLEIRGGSFNVDPSTYVDKDNYTVTKNGSIWTVSANSN